MKVALLVTCLIDAVRPSAARATVTLLERAGCQVAVPVQACCGQPAFNAGDREAARAVARPMIAAFEGFDAVVAPSGSCAGMAARHWPDLFGDDPAWAERARAVAARTHELTAFLVDVLKRPDVVSPVAGPVAYHDSCSSLRDCGVFAQPRALLAAAGAQVTEVVDPQACCGFGGLFCVKHPDVSGAIVGKKTAALAATGAEVVLAGDLGCLLNIAGKARREGRAFQVRHIAEALAGDLSAPPVGADK